MRSGRWSAGGPLRGRARRPGRRIASGFGPVVALAGCACLLLAACSAPAVEGSPTDARASAGASAEGAGVTFAAVGDSVTDADSADFAAGDLGPASWATYAVEAGAGFAGGWAEWGATTGRMAEQVVPYEADVLVLLAGTNDVAFGIPFEESAANLERIVDAVGIAEVVVVSIPPIDAAPGNADDFNDRLEGLAGDRGWRFVDASAGLRSPDGRFRDGMSFDGLHPSEEGARVLGAAIAEVLATE